MTTSLQTYSYYPGCSQMATNKAYDISTRNVARVLGLELVELEDWNCCGATAYFAIREERALVLSARNLALAEKAGHDLVTPCSGCYVALRKATKYMTDNPELHAKIECALATGGMTYSGPVRVRHVLDLVLNDAGEEAIRQHVRRPLDGLRVACYYGCQVTRPFGEIDREELPDRMDRLVEWLGAEPVPFPLKTKCCGGLMMTTQPDIGRKLTGKLLSSAKTNGADCIITCCPLCQISLEAYQREVSGAMQCDCRIPVLYFTQLMGHAFGLSSEELALQDSLTPVEPLLARKAAHV